MHALRAFQHRNFRLFFYGQSLSLLGTWTQQVAMSWLVYRLTGSPFYLGLTAFAGQFPILVLAPFGGIWADQFDRRKLLIATQILAMVQALILAGLAYSAWLEVWHIVAMATLLGVVMALDTPIRQALVPNMVPSREDLPAAIAFNGVMQNAGRMIGPTIAGVLVAVSSEAFCFLVNAASKIAVIVAVLLMHLPHTPPTSARPALMRGLADGMRYAWNVIPIRLLLPIIALASFMATPYQTLMPIFAKEVFGGGAETLGFLMGAAGLGGTAGLIYLASRQNVRGLTRFVLGGLLLTGGSLIVFAYSHVMALSLVMVALAGLGIIVNAMAVNTIFQTIVDDPMRGRVMSLFTVAFLGISPLGSLAAGTLAHAIGADRTLAIGGACCILGALWLARRMPRLRRHMRPIYQRLGIVETAPH